MRVKAGTVTRRRHNKVLEAAKGYRLKRSKSFRQAKETLLHAGQYAYVGRKKRTGQLRSIWINRINIALDEMGISYSVFINKLKEAKVEINRKMLAELAVNNPEVFNKIVALAK